MSTDPINDFIEAMTLDELKANARLAIVSNAWLNLDIECVEDDHRDMADDAIYQASSAAIGKDFQEFTTARENEGSSEEVASANWHRWLLNKMPLGENKCEIDRPGFKWTEVRP